MGRSPEQVDLWFSWFDSTTPSPPGAPDQTLELREVWCPVQGRQPLLLHTQQRTPESIRALHGDESRCPAAVDSRSEHLVGRRHGCGVGPASESRWETTRLQSLSVRF